MTFLGLLHVGHCLLGLQPSMPLISAAPIGRGLLMCIPELRLIANVSHDLMRWQVLSTGLSPLTKQPVRGRKAGGGIVGCTNHSLLHPCPSC